ncbi:nuclear transport factor 2 family protein [Streptomyces sp. N50]|uniref:nuclear transport factor 2 family protein n=1 Tax=Streptomyces sp. N50 TaxID=3081765 RepID=UPI0029620AA5|nr:nuclear transport factor 2 family protein [Streptomyces sp. N50]WOX16971.1 nuclear transport factor 2 family protein [Streptomyces sp. N50]
MQTRTPEEVYASHGAALVAEDLDKLAANFAEDAVVVTPKGVLHGKEGVRENFTRLFADLPKADWEMKTTLFGGEVLFLEWTATSAKSSATHGVDTFVIRDGLIRAQTVRYELASNDV